MKTKWTESETKELPIKNRKQQKRIAWEKNYISPTADAKPGQWIHSLVNKSYKLDGNVETLEREPADNEMHDQASTNTLKTPWLAFP